MTGYRTLLFVPAIKKNWFDKIPAYAADAVILDLEDSVPIQLKEHARNNAQDAIAGLARAGVQVFVRINRTDEFNWLDLNAVIQPGLAGIVLPKLDAPQEIELLSGLLDELEQKYGLKHGTVKLLPILETAKSMQFAYDIACCQRVTGIAGLTAKNGDVARALGYQWTKGGLETLFMRSKIVMAARAAGVQPIGGLWQDVHNLTELREHAAFNRQLGFSGEMVLHPSNIPIVNEIYMPSAEDIAYYRGMLAAFAVAEKNGESAILYRGEHIDYAHIKTARKMLAAVEQYHTDK